MARGLGLDLLKEFIRLNNGKLEVYTNKGYALIDNETIAFKDRERAFPGTMFHMTIVCDETLYIFEDEDEEDELENKEENPDGESKNKSEDEL